MSDEFEKSKWCIEETKRVNKNSPTIDLIEQCLKNQITLMEYLQNLERKLDTIEHKIFQRN